MATVVLPAEWEARPHSQRVREAIELGRRSRTDPAAAEQLREWASGGFTLRLLAAFAGHGSRDSAATLALTRDPSRTVSRIAMNVLGHVGDDDSLLAALRDLPARRVTRTLYRLRGRRPKAVDRFLAERADAGDGAVWPLVPLGSITVIERYLDRAAERGGDAFWGRFAALHPARAVAEVVARLDRAATPDGLLFDAARRVFLFADDRDPDAALQLVAALRRHVPLATISLGALAYRRPVAVADLVLGADEPASANFEAVVSRLDTARIVRLLRRKPGGLRNPDEWLRRLPAPERETIYREFAPAWTDRDGLIPAAILRRLPAPLRQAEARRIAAKPVLATRPLVRLMYVGLLPWDEARAAVAPWLASPEAEHRSAALLALGEAARFDRSRLGDLLDLLAARRHEQDPVRQGYLTALATLPPGRWEAAHLPGLARVVRDALDAGDLSYGSVVALGRLVLALLPSHPGWAAEQFVAVIRERGNPGWSGRQLTAEDVRRIAPALSPVVATWLNRTDEGRVIALASTVGRYLPEWPELVGSLETLVRTGSDNGASSAMTLIAAHVPAERERIILAALDKDPTWAYQLAVLNFLHARRQDRLTPYLGRQVFKGRFSTGKVRYVLPLGSGFARWTDAQQETFAGSLADLARPPARKDEAQVTSDVLWAVRRLAALPAVGPGRLVTLAHDRRAAIQETAVRALGRLDARDGIPELLDALGDARARWAVYALRQALNDLTPGRVLAVMRDVPLAKVTVAKEAIRLAGELGGADALPWFADLHHRDLHRDVRGALLRALWDHLDRPEAWTILDESITSPDPGVVIGLARIPVGRVSAGARERVTGLLRRLLDHPEPTVRLAVLGRLAAQPVPDPGRHLLAALLDRLASPVPDEQATALTAALAGTTDADAPAFADAFARLLPRRRELAAAVDRLVLIARSYGQRHRAVGAAVLAAVEADPGLLRLQIALATVAMPPLRFARWVLDLADTPRWHAATQLAAIDALSRAGYSPGSRERIGATWAESPDPAARWMALRVLVEVASLRGWTDGRRARLDRFRADPSPMVRDEAALTFPPEPSATEESGPSAR